MSQHNSLSRLGADNLHLLGWLTMLLVAHRSTRVNSYDSYCGV
jgi:hypothetical protein